MSDAFVNPTMRLQSKWSKTKRFRSACMGSDAERCALSLDSGSVRSSSVRRPEEAFSNEAEAYPSTMSFLIMLSLRLSL